MTRPLLKYRPQSFFTKYPVLRPPESTNLTLSMFSGSEPSGHSRSGSRDETVREQRAADILLLPLRREPEYAKVLPGKIFEYLAARRPVLGIGQEDGAAAAVLRDAAAGQMFDWDKKDELLAFLDAEHPQTEGIEKYTRRALTAQLAELLQ